MPARPLHDTCNGRRESRTAAPPVSCNLGEVADLSPTGARIRLRRRPTAAVGDVIELFLGNDAAPSRARIVWIRRTGLFRHELGVEFLEDHPPRTLRLPPPAMRPLRRSA